MMTPDEEKLILKWHDGISDEVEIFFLFSDDRRSDLFQDFCGQFSNLCSKVKVTRKKSDEPKDPPGLEVYKGLIYHAIPLGPELTPFLETLSRSSKGGRMVSQSVSGQLKNLKIPCIFKLFIASTCPHCPKMVQDLAPMSLTSELISLTIIDGGLFPEMADSLDIKSAPTLLFDDRMRWTGQTPLTEILDVVLNQDPSLLSAASIENLLGDGKAALLAHMMMERGTIFPRFYDVLTSEKFSVRLGAMVVMEEIIDQSQSLAGQCVSPLWERFTVLNEQVRGDVIYILGQAGNRDVVPHLKAVLGGPYSDETRETAREALDAIMARE